MKKHKASRVITSFAFMFIICISLLLIARTKSHRTAASFRAAALSTSTGQLIPGVTLRDFVGRTPSGKKVEVSAMHPSGSLVFVLSPTCPFCRVNFHNWRELASEVDRNQVVWADVSGSITPKYLSSVGLSQDDRVISLDKNDVNLRKFEATPTTVALAPDGRVRWVWSGVLGSKQMADLKAILRRR